MDDKKEDRTRAKLAYSEQKHKNNIPLGTGQNTFPLVILIHIRRETNSVFNEFPKHVKPIMF
jgi:hypothetical protein